MNTTASATRRGIVIGVVLAMLAVALWAVNESRAEAATPATPLLAQIGDNPDLPPVQVVAGWYAKYDGVDGESVDEAHENWFDLVGYEWGLERPGGAATGATRRRAAAVLDPFILTFDYEKTATKMLEKCLKGAFVPKLEVELTTTFEARETYLRYEMKNVSCSMYEVGGISDGTRPTVSIANYFEEITVTYTEFGDDGQKRGNVVTTWKVEPGV